MRDHEADCDTWLDREEAELDKWFNAGDITQEEYDAQVIALRKEYRQMLRERD